MKLFTKEIDKKLFAQYKLGSDLANQEVVAKIFNPYGRGVWYILNSDPNDPDYLWAIVDLLDVEVGSVSRAELEAIKVPPFGLKLERDLYFTPRNAKEVYEGALSGKRFDKGGTTDENAQMVLNQNKQIAHHTEELPNAVKKASHVPAWVVAKVNRSANDLSDATHYLDGESSMMRGGGNVKLISEGQEYRYMGINYIEKDIIDKIRPQIAGLKFAGNFSIKGSRTDGYLYFLDDFDKKLVENIPLKHNERIYRYYTRNTAIGGMMPLLKINLDSGLIYFNEANDFGDETIKFGTKGEKAEYINLVKAMDSDYYAQGGGVEDTEAKVMLERSAGGEYFLFPKEAKGKDLGIMLKGGGNLSSKATYVPNREIKEISVDIKGKSKTLKGSDILDGMYVKKKSFKQSKKTTPAPAPTPAPAETKNKYYVEFLNSKKNFQKDIKYFDTYQEAKEWMVETFDKFDPDMISSAYGQGGNIFDFDYSKLVGKRLMYGFDSREGTEKWFSTIAKADVTPANFRYRSLNITNDNDYTEIIKEEDIKSFLKGDWVELRDSQGEYYVIKLMDKVKFAGGGGVGEIKFTELVGNKFSIKRGSSTETGTWEKEDLLEGIKRVIKHELFDRDFYYNWTNEGMEYSNIFDEYTLNPMLKDIDKTLNEYFVMKKYPNNNTLEFKEHSQEYVDNWFKTNPRISPTLRNDYKKYREKYAGVTPYADGGGVGKDKEIQVSVYKNGKFSGTKKVMFMDAVESKTLDPMSREWNGYYTIRQEDKDKVFVPKETGEDAEGYLVYTEIWGLPAYTNDWFEKGGGVGSIPPQIKSLIDYMTENKIQRKTFKAKNEEGKQKFLSDIKSAVDKNLVRVQVNPIDKNEIWISLSNETQNKLKFVKGGGVGKIKIKTSNQIYANDLLRYADLQNIGASSKKVGSSYIVTLDSPLEIRNSMNGEIKSLLMSKMATGGTTPKQQKKIGKVMHEFKEGDLKTSAGTKVTNPKQAVAIALSEAGVPKKGWGHKKGFRK